MGNLYKNIHGVTGNSILIGSTLLKDNAGTIEIKNENDTAYNKILIADPVGALEGVNRGSLKTIPEVRHYIYTDYILNIKANATADGGWKEATMIEDGEILGISVYISANRTAGTASFFAMINQAAQNQVGKYIVINSNTRRAYLKFDAPIEYTAGQSLGVRSVTSGFSPNNTTATVTLWLRSR